MSQEHTWKIKIIVSVDERDTEDEDDNEDESDHEDHCDNEDVRDIGDVCDNEDDGMTRMCVTVMMSVMMRMMGIMIDTVASAPPPRILELQEGFEAGPEPHPLRSTKTESKYLQKKMKGI